MADFPLQFLLTVKNEMGSGISQATGQIKGLGDAADQTQKKAKSSGMGVGAAFQFVALNAFNLATSLIQTKRSYEDLAKAENAQQVKREAVGKASRRLENAEITLASARKKGDPARIAKAENALTTARVNLTQKTRAEKLGQVELNRAHEDFYLNIIPNVISGIGTLAGILQVAQNTSISFGGTLTKLVLPVAAISAAFFAIKTNFLGFRDFLQGIGVAVGNAVPGLKPLLNVLEAIGGALGLTPKKTNLNSAIKGLMDQFKPLIDLAKGTIDQIMKGNWEGAFAVIRQAAMKFWIQLQKDIPFFGGVATLIEQISNGDWNGAFRTIRAAAAEAWKWLKINVPLFGDIEKIVLAISQGKWADAFNAIKAAIVNSGLPAAIDTLFGKDWITNVTTRLTSIPEIIKSTANLAMNEAKNGNWAGVGRTIGEGIASGMKASGGQDVIDAITNLGIGPASILQAMKDPKQTKMWADIGAEIGKQLSGVVKNVIDPFVTSLLTPQNWTEAFAKAAKGAGQIAAALMNAIFPKDQKTGNIAAAANMAGSFMLSFFQGIGTWIVGNTPQIQGALKKLVASFIAGVNTIGANILLIGKSVVNFVLKGITDNFSPDNLARVARAAVSGLSKAIADAAKSLQQIGARIGNYIVQGILKVFAANSNLLPFGNTIGNAIKNMPEQHAAGFHGFVSGATPMIAGERGIEKVDITPMSDIVNRRQSGGSTGVMTVIVPVMLNGKQIAEVVASEITVDQAVYR